MATYAILGATGQVGGSILEVLIHRSDINIHAFVRSKQKLLTARPELESTSNTTIYEGGLDDIEILADCISATSAVFMAIAAMDNLPGTDVARHQAKSVVAALELLRQRDSYTKLPQLIVLSSSSLDAHLERDLPWIGRAIIHRAAYFVYEDLRLAEKFLRSCEWVKQVYVKPGGLVHDERHGHILSTDRQQTFLSFIDLAGGMVEIADTDDDKFDLKNVSVQPATPGTKIEWYVPYFALKGLLCYYIPWLSSYFMNWLP